jgi:hypothetical protein
LVYRRGWLTRSDSVSSDGTLYEGEDSARFVYDDGRLIGWENRDRSGAIKQRIWLSSDFSEVRWTDELGRPQAKKGRAASGLRRRFGADGQLLGYRYVDAFGTPVTADGVGEVRTQRSAIGAPTDESFFDLNGAAVVNGSGAHRITHLLNAHDFELERRYFDTKDRPTLIDGVHLWRRKYDAVGNPTEIAYFGIDGAPTRAAGSRAHAIRYTRDARGNEIAREFLDESGLPLLTAYGYASTKRRVDEHGREIDLTLCGIDRAPTKGRDGYAVLREDRDASGNVIRERFFDENAQPVSSSQGYQRAEIAYDERNNPIAFRFEDRTGALVVTTLGYAMRALSYDGDRLTGTRYLDANQQLVNLPQRYAEIRTSYAPSGQSTDVFVAANGVPLPLKLEPIRGERLPPK